MHMEFAAPTRAKINISTGLFRLGDNLELRASESDNFSWIWSIIPPMYFGFVSPVKATLVLHVICVCSLVPRPSPVLQAMKSWAWDWERG